jgi:predicted DNA-binding transcriptional regulator YafY
MTEFNEEFKDNYGDTLEVSRIGLDRDNTVFVTVIENEDQAQVGFTPPVARKVALSILAASVEDDTLAGQALTAVRDLFTALDPSTEPETEPESYHGFKVGERVKDPFGSVWEVVKRDPNAVHGIEDRWVPIQRVLSDGTLSGSQDGHLPRSLTRVEAEPKPEIETVDPEAVEYGTTVTFLYQGEADSFPRQRRVEVGQADSEYIEGEDLDSGGFRRFRTDRIHGDVIVVTG